MAIPVIIGVAAAAAAALGVGKGVHGGKKMKDANDTMKEAKAIQEGAIKDFEENNIATTKKMDKLGEKELTILNDFSKFSNIVEKIQGRPEIKELKIDGIDLKQYEAEELKNVSAGAGILLGGLGGASLGTAGGFAAAGATTAAVTAFGSASTGAAIAGLHGAAAANATLAALGGGAIAAGGGGMALGAVMLGVASAGVGLLIGGLIFDVAGKKLSEKADDAYDQACKTKTEIDKILVYLKELKRIATDYYDCLIKVNDQYNKHLQTLDSIVNFYEKTNWKDFTDKEKKITENTILLVGLLFNMCKVKLVLKSDDNKQINEINEKEINEVMGQAEVVMKKTA